MRTPLIFILLLSFSAAANAAENALDFAYRVTGTAANRPLLVFNDGKDTYVQPNPSAGNMKFVGVNVERQGPYYVIRGLSNDFTMSIGKTSVSVTYQGRSKKKQEVKQVQQITQWPAVQTALTHQMPNIVERSKTPVNTCKKHQSDSAYVVAFPKNSAAMSKDVMASLKEALFISKTIEKINILSEGSGTLPDRRTDAIKKVILGAGIDINLVETSKRESTGIGSELRIHRVVTQCNEIRIKSLKESAKVVWDGDISELLADIASSIGMKFSVIGEKRHLIVAVNSIDSPLVEVLKEIGQQMGDSGAVVLRDNEIQVKFK